MRERSRRAEQPSGRQSRARPEETTALVLTGAGLKATQRIGELMGILPEARAWSE